MSFYVNNNPYVKFGLHRGENGEIGLISAIFQTSNTLGGHSLMKNGLKVYILIVKHNNNNEYVKTIEFDDGCGFAAKNTYISVWQGGKEIVDHEHLDMYIPYDEISFVGTFGENED